eukprot:TRINITY_DN9811_c0_g1_i1.p1 TRINITY_DN9811_c0_g1~~TRINITY_DN9811_c0_g1_i1.p1  ORF type:complete len:190 (-),score=22.77 TRINITY_DN9811_c0_g1_i1:223-792(-)
MAGRATLLTALCLFFVSLWGMGEATQQVRPEASQHSPERAANASLPLEGKKQPAGALDESFLATSTSSESLYSRLAQAQLPSWDRMRDTVMLAYERRVELSLAACLVVFGLISVCAIVYVVKPPTNARAQPLVAVPVAGAAKEANATSPGSPLRPRSQAPCSWPSPPREQAQASRCFPCTPPRAQRLLS